jgi:YggT family protein
MPILISVISALFRVYALLILVRVILSWVNVNPYRRLDHPLVLLLNRVTDPVLAPLRRIIPPIGGAIDVTPIVALILLELARLLIVSLLLRI